MSVVEETMPIPTTLLADIVRVLLDPDEEERDGLARFLLYGMLRYEGVTQGHAPTLVEESLALIEAQHRGETISEKDMEAVSNRLAENMGEDA